MRAGRIAEEVIQHLAGLADARAVVGLDMQAEVPEGASDEIVRTVGKNYRTLGFESCQFEEE